MGNSLEIFGIAQGLIGTLLGGFLVILGGYLTDKRRERAQQASQDDKESALYTAIFAVSNHITECLNDFQDKGTLSRLFSLRIPQSYVHRIIDKESVENQSLMICIVDIGLKLDALISTVSLCDKQSTVFNKQLIAEDISREVDQLYAALEQAQVIITGELPFMDDEELSQFEGFEEALNSSHNETDRVK